jgi:hypothetical protein
MVMAQYSDAEIQFVAGEPTETMQLRAQLESRKKMLEDGEDAFHTAMGQNF